MVAGLSDTFAIDVLLTGQRGSEGGFKYIGIKIKAGSSHGY